MNRFALPLACPVTAAIEKLAARLQTVAPKSISIAEATGHCLAEDIYADRDSPALNVSAMDGFALRLADYSNLATFKIAGECSAGSPPLDLPVGCACKIFTGASVPTSADMVIERELAHLDTAGKVSFHIDNNELKLGRNIRFQGENIRAEQRVLEAGALINSSAMASLASFGSKLVTVRERLRVSVLNTGNEIVSAGELVQAYQIRDSNGPMLEAMLSRESYAQLVSISAVADDRKILRHAICQALDSSDALLLTGGVSAGDYDYVPEMLKELGVEIVFHRLPQRPGRPVLGGVGPQGQLVCGLPGNPISVAVTARRIALPLMRFIASGRRDVLTGSPVQIQIQMVENTSSTICYWMVKLDLNGVAHVIATKGSGDIVALGQSDGFVESNPFQHPLTSVNFYKWN